MKIFKNILYFLVIAICVSVITFSFTHEKISVVSSSMNPTLYEGNVGFTDKVFFKVFDIKRFDIIVVKHNNKLIIKRVIGLPGETIQYKDNKLYVNKKYVEETFLENGYNCDTCTNYQNFTREKLCIDGLILDSDEFFVLGDNRLVSSDSRYFLDKITFEDIYSRGFFKIGDK